MKKYCDPLESNRFYHVYNRGNNKETIFRNNENYTFFLEKWKKYLNDYLEVWAYCLMPNHFHFLIKVEHRKQFSSVLDRSDYELIPNFLSNEFRKLFISYSKSFNSVYDRTGSLFQKPFKRIKVDSNIYLQSLIHYIHHNPIHHGFTQNYLDWDYSSFKAITSDQSTKVKRQKVLELFHDSKDEFISSHEEIKNYNKIDHLIIE